MKSVSFNFVEALLESSIDDARTMLDFMELNYKQNPSSSSAFADLVQAQGTLERLERKLALIRENAFEARIA